MNRLPSISRRFFARTFCAGRPSDESVERMKDGPRKKDERREDFLRARYKERLTDAPKPLILLAFTFASMGVLSYGLARYRGLAPGGRRFSVLCGEFVSHSRLYETPTLDPLRPSKRVPIACDIHRPRGLTVVSYHHGGPHG